MGEIAEMMLDGTLCEGCGEFMDGDGDGIPRYCSPQCAARSGMIYEQPISRAKARKGERVNLTREIAAGGIKTFSCPVCSKRFRYTTALEQHQRDKHSTAATT